jgi:rare lipoprotein A
VEGRIVDLSKRAAQQLDFIPLGIVEVKVETISREEDNPEGQASINKAKTTTPGEFYEVKASRVQPTGFGIQIGSFKELANLMRISDNLKNSYQKEVTVQVVVVNQIKVYRIIIGTFQSRNDAERQMKKLKNDYPDCFIVDFGKR